MRPLVLALCLSAIPAAAAAAATPLSAAAVDLIPPADCTDGATPQSAPTEGGLLRLWVRPPGQLVWARLTARRVRPDSADLPRLDREVGRFVNAAAKLEGGRAIRSRMRALGETQAYEVWFTGTLGADPRLGALLVVPVDGGTLELLLLGETGAEREKLDAGWEQLVAGVKIKLKRPHAASTAYTDAAGLRLQPPPQYHDLPAPKREPDSPAEQKAAWMRHGLQEQQALMITFIRGGGGAAYREQARAAEGKAPVALEQVARMPVPAEGTGGALPYAVGGETTLLVYQALPGGRLSLSALLPRGKEDLLVLAYLAAQDDFADHLPAFGALCAQVQPRRTRWWPFAVAGVAALLLAAFIALRKRRAT
ncbi:MAG: hypothetical protein HY906_21895 [Deltaproteobacteria bacterium]|nr:hypothetical protein [Deltaproteobacteria bacterium]